MWGSLTLKLSSLIGRLIVRIGALTINILGTVENSTPTWRISGLSK